MGFLDRVKQMLGSQAPEPAAVGKTAAVAEDHTPESAETVAEEPAEETRDTP